jgi:hypothetical protein
MDVGMITKVPRPGVKDGHEADLPANEPGPAGTFQERPRGGAEEGVVENPLMSVGLAPQFLRHGEGGEEIGNGEQGVPLFFNPGRGVVVLTGGTMAVVAGMIAVM